MSTYTAITTAPGRAPAEALGDALDALADPPTGVGVFEVEDGSGLWEIGAYFTDPPDETALALLAAAFGAQPFIVSRLDDRDWVAQVRRELSPVHAGPFVVHGGHDAGRITPNAIGLRIEAAMAFGTGHHATTLGCLLMLARLARSGLAATRVADIGTGTGILAMAAVRLWHCCAVAGDLDPVAVATARANLRANRVAPGVPVVRGAGFQGAVFRQSAPYDLVFANILAGPLKRLAPEVRRFLSPDGVVVLSGLLDRQAPAVAAVYAGQGLQVIATERRHGWSSLALSRRRWRIG
ncbi:MAG: 50S ribosomal protein L11 methyltransferase [Pseudomonadota bacterium]